MFTSLPRRYVDEIINLIPELDSIFSFILCEEEMTFNEGFMVKDLSIFFDGRELENIFVIDTDLERVDGDIVASMHPRPYDG